MRVALQFLGVTILALGALSSFAGSGVSALFSPHQGEKAFNQIFELIKSADNSVRITLYSWSDSGLDHAIKVALEKGIDVKVVLNPALAKKTNLKKRILNLELLGAEFKRAKHNMHEKFVLIDDRVLVNSSANMSTGAKNKYSENYVFHYADVNPSLENLILEFRHEFAILWNTASDIITHNEGLSKELTYQYFDGSKILNLPRKNNPGLYSSSQNFTISKNETTSKNFKNGKSYKMTRRGGVKNQSWFIKDMILEAVNGAESQILVALNHFNVREISDALIEAVKRGVDVRLAVDNQEFKTYPNNKEMTPQFVKDWKRLDGNKNRVPPVRVKFYSHAPSPRYWLLNHHKFILIDYAKNGNGTTLISGSYNVSKNAEHNQFDNMIFYGGKTYKGLYTSFRDEFQNLWGRNRGRKEEILKKLMTPRNGAYRLHSKEAISLTWNETSAIRKEIGKKAKGIFKNLYRSRNCTYYNSKLKIFEAYDSKQGKVVPCGVSI